MSKVNDYFKAHLKLTLALMWIFLVIAVGYALLCLLGFPTWPFWLMLIPAAVALYFRLVYNRGYYDKHPEKDRYSDQYIPYKERKKLEEEEKRQNSKKK